MQEGTRTKQKLRSEKEIYDKFMELIDIHRQPKNLESQLARYGAYTALEWVLGKRDKLG